MFFPTRSMLVPIFFNYIRVNKQNVQPYIRNDIIKYIYFFTHPILKNEYFHIIILNAEMHKLNSVWSLGEDIYLKIY